MNKKLNKIVKKLAAVKNEIEFTKVFSDVIYDELNFYNKNNPNITNDNAFRAVIDFIKSILIKLYKPYVKKNDIKITFFRGSNGYEFKFLDLYSFLLMCGIDDEYIKTEKTKVTYQNKDIVASIDADGRGVIINKNKLNI